MKHQIVDALGNMKGVHNDKIGNAHSDGLFVWILVLGVAFAVFCKAAPAPEPDCTLVIAGVCL
jgi:hypothetical protein